MVPEEFVGAVIEDSLNIASTVIPIPRELIKWLLKKMEKNPTNKYLNTDYDRILDFYNKEKNNLLTLNYNNETEYLPQYLQIDNTKNSLEMNQFVFKFSKEVYYLPDEIKDYTSNAFKQLTKTSNFRHGENLRLSNLTFENNIYTFHTQPVMYEDYMLSNMLMDYQLNQYDSLRERIHRLGRLESFSESKLANHIGINILLFTPAGYLIMPQRSNKVIYAPLELSASISGAVQSRDIIPGQSLDSFEFAREGIEELGLSRDDILIDSVKFLGLTRELIRGGKPEIFFKMKTNLNKNEIEKRWKNARDKWENKKLNFYLFDPDWLNPIKDEKTLNSFNVHFNKFLEEHGAKMSLPFITNLALWKKLKVNGG